MPGCPVGAQTTSCPLRYVTRKDLVSHKFASGAVSDLQRLREFCGPKTQSPPSAAGHTIIKAVQVLGLQPQIGRPIEDMSDEFRE
jgi:hypothetical protein